MVHLAFIRSCSSAYQLIVVVIVISAMVFTCLSLLVRFWGTTYQVHGEVRVLSYYSPAFLFSYRRLLSGFQDVRKVFSWWGSWYLHLTFTCLSVLLSSALVWISGCRKSFFVAGIMVSAFDIHLPFCSLIVGSCLDLRMPGKEKQYACQTYCFFVQMVHYCAAARCNLRNISSYLVFCWDTAAADTFR